MVKQDKSYTAGKSAIFHATQKKKRDVFIFGIMKIKSDFSNREGEEKNAYESN